MLSAPPQPPQPARSPSPAMSADSKAFDELYLAPDAAVKPPYVNATRYLVGGELVEWKGDFSQVRSPILVRGSAKHIIIGQAPTMTEREALAAVEAAHRAFNFGMGEWPQLHPAERIARVERFVERLQQKRAEIVNILMWEICKNEDDAKKEVDRTIEYIRSTIVELKKLENTSATFEIVQGYVGHIRRAPYGVVLCLGPFNYPFNETYCTLIPAIIMGNAVVMKLPKVGVLCHQPTLELFKECFPPGVVNIISGSGRTMMNPIMASGKLDILAFIGTNAAADALQKAHPAPHRLRVCLGLDAKNPAIILPSADLNVAVSECVLGSLSFNGQRCTALKILFVHESIADKFLAKFCEAVDALRMGLPWEKDVKITPLPEPEKPHYLEAIIADAVAKGARVANRRGNLFDRTFVAPTVLFPVNKTMKCWHEEQFGPVVPVASFKDLEEIYTYMRESPFGQQASIFGTDRAQVSQLIDVLVNTVARVNLNTQCQRGPDVFPFTGRKDSAYGTLSVFDALRVFSIRSMVATKAVKENQELVKDIARSNSSNFLRLDYMF